MNLARLNSALGHEFRDSRRLMQALTHRSYGSDNNERYEFLGDAVFNCVVAEYLMDRFPGLPEGELSRLRAGVVCGDSLTRVARRIGLGELLRLGEGERKSGGHDRASILADALEAVIGAVHRDGGFDAARAVVLRLFSDALAAIDPAASAKDAKTRLQEYLQGRRMALPDYALFATRGAAHDQEFEVRCNLAELGVTTSGTGPSRRAAEQVAAQRALEALGQ